MHIHSSLDQDKEEGEGVEGGTDFSCPAGCGRVSCESGVWRKPQLVQNKSTFDMFHIKTSRAATLAPVLRYPTVYLFRYYNMRTESFKELRQELQESSRCSGMFYYHDCIVLPVFCPQLFSFLWGPTVLRIGTHEAYAWQEHICGTSIR